MQPYKSTDVQQISKLSLTQLKRKTHKMERMKENIDELSIATCSIIIFTCGNILNGDDLLTPIVSFSSIGNLGASADEDPKILGCNK